MAARPFSAARTCWLAEFDFFHSAVTCSLTLVLENDRMWSRHDDGPSVRLRRPRLRPLYAVSSSRTKPIPKVTDLLPDTCLFVDVPGSRLSPSNLSPSRHRAVASGDLPLVVHRRPDDAFFAG